MARVRTMIEVGQRSIRLLQMRKDKNELSLFHFDAVKADSATEDSLGAALAQMVAGKKILGNDMVAVLPRWCALLRQLSLPAQDEEELRKIVVLHLGQVGPFSRENVYYDFSVLDQDEDGYSRVLLVVVPREAVDRLLRILQKARVNCSKIVLSSFGVRNWLSHQQSTGEITADDNVMLIDLARNDSEICFIEKSSLAFSRGVSCGSVDLDQGNKELLLEQIDMTLETHKKEHGGAFPERIIVVSNGGQGEILKEALRTKYSIPIGVLDSLAGMTCRAKVPSRVSAMTTGASLASLAGFSSENDDGFDLMPTEVLERARSLFRKKAVVRFLAAATLCLLLIFGKQGVDIVHKQIYFDQVEKELALSQKQVRKSEEMMRALEFIVAKQKNRIFVADVVRELYQNTPHTVSFRSINLRQDGSFEIEGYANDQTAVNELQSSLVASPLFKEVTLKYATKRKKAREEFTAFKIICRIQAAEEKDGG